MWEKVIYYVLKESSMKIYNKDSEVFENSVKKNKLNLSNEQYRDLKFLRTVPYNKFQGFVALVCNKSYMNSTR